MKKVFAIIAIMVVLVGAVFADPAPAPASESHTITVQAAVYGELPKFQLQLIGAEQTTITNNSTPVQFTDTEEYTASGILSRTDNEQVDANGIPTVFTLDKAGSIVVAAKVANAAKVLKAYTLTFTGGVFTNVYRDGDTTNAGTYVPTAIATSLPTGTVTGTTTSNYGEGTVANGASALVTFSLTAATAGQEIARCTFTYPGDDDINPGNYYADIQMVVTAE